MYHIGFSRRLTRHARPSVQTAVQSKESAVLTATIGEVLPHILVLHSAIS